MKLAGLPIGRHPNGTGLGVVIPLSGGTNFSKGAHIESPDTRLLLQRRENSVPGRMYVPTAEAIQRDWLLTKHAYRYEAPEVLGQGTRAISATYLTSIIPALL